MDVRTGGGETRRLQGVDAKTPFSSVGRLAHGDSGGARRSGSVAGWLTDFDVLDEGDGGDGEVCLFVHVWVVSWLVFLLVVVLLLLYRSNGGVMRNAAADPNVPHMCVSWLPLL